MATWVLPIFLCIVMAKTVYGNGTLSDSLLEYVWQDYHNEVRPVCGDYPGTVNVHLGIALRQLMEMDEPKQILWSSIWIRLYWHDCRLQWNSSDYDGYSRLTVPRYKIWYPDLTLYDNAESKLGDLEFYRISVDSHGDVHSLVPVVIKSMCKLDLRKFPFDQQYCNLTFGSWAYTGFEVNLTALDQPTDLSSFIEHGEWEVVSLTQVHVELLFDNSPYSQEIFTLHLRRKPLYYMVNLILPSILLQALAVVGFMLPTESNEKVNLEITVLLALSVFQLVVLDMMPPTSDNFPVIAVYLMSAMALITLSCIATVFVLNIHFVKRQYEVPKCIMKTMRGPVGRFFGINKQLIALHARHNAKYKPVKNVFTVGTPYNPFKHRAKDDETLPSWTDNTPAFDDSSIDNGIGDTPETFTGGSQMNELVHVAWKILEYLQIIAEHKKKRSSHDRVEGEWRILSNFLDKIFLVLFLFLEISFMVSVFSSIAAL